MKMTSIAVPELSSTGPSGAPGWLAMVLLLMAGAADAAPACYRYGGAWENNIPSKLYLYFPTADDATFPNYAASVSPARRFDVADLDSSIGTTAQLRDRVFDTVVDAYCEINVQVRQSTTNPDALLAPPGRRNIVAIGSDAGPAFGRAEFVDLNNAHNVDHARVWSASYPHGCGASSGALTGANSTLARWANAIGGTAAHEAGHNYGLQHGDDGVIRAGEDNRFNHIMPSATLAGESPPVPTCDFRAGVKRHFSDATFSILAHNVGLVSQSVGNWDFVNPNPTTATRMEMELLSTAATLTLTNWWNGLWSPWQNPTVSGALGTVTVAGISYNRFRLTWATGKVWQGRNMPGASQTPGNVPQGVSFHVGAEFNGTHYYDPDPVIVRDITLFDAANNPLPLRPRMAGFDNGTLDFASGDFALRVFNFGEPLLLRDVRILELPRPVALDAMRLDANGDPMPLRTWDGREVTPWRITEVGELRVAENQPVRLPVRNLRRDGHNVLIRHGATSPADAVAGGVEENPDIPGSISVDLFPATTVYVTARVIDTSITYIDPVTGQQRNPEALLFHQVMGRRDRPPLSGSASGFRQMKSVCTNLSTRQVTTAQTPEADRPPLLWNWDCSNAGFASGPGNAINITFKGRYASDLFQIPPRGTVENMAVQKVVCTNLNTRQSANGTVNGNAWSCGDTLPIKENDNINVIVKGVIPTPP